MLQNMNGAIKMDMSEFMTVVKNDGNLLTKKESRGKEMIITNEEMKKAKEDHKETDYTSYTNGLDMLKKMGDNGREWAFAALNI